MGSLRTSGEVATGHPFAWLQLAKNDGIELIAALDRQCAAAPLRQIGRSNPCHQRLVRLGCRVRTAKRKSCETDYQACRR